MEENQKIEDILIAKHLAGDISFEEELQLDAWVKKSEENQLHFEGMKAVWEATQPGKVSAAVDVDKAWNKFSEEIETKKGKTIQFTPWQMVSAAVAAMLVIFFGVRFFQQSNTTVVDDVQRFATTTSTLLDTLNDGSVITLNQESALAVQSFDGNSREMTLDGEAYFEVAHNEDQPFIVHTKYGDVTVLGTKFNVNTLDNKVTVTVTDGLVKLTAPNKKYVLLPKGKQGIYASGQAVPLKNEVNVVNEMFWKHQKLEFKNAEFQEVVKSIEKAYDVKIEVNNENLYHKEVTSSFDHESIEGVLQVMEATLNLRVQKTADKQYLID
ncbi:FecR domain-containing protein [Flammeovirga yaeyamensis]|uniref:FecR domain-containing protein n=1 Tax=Flammeovirga yaeyamensis TaxID=367791 RepID=A0AAX1N079_9BACT|nr:FecR domain-containing protein [Flammeovirga yaeyamensis]MBB3700150.1 ferric-dicitrate binding protein FerR (iron transport regulator) [Flammeovirga yaeyamensis]NMF37220.1 DUF4974 domain-containing protein [Flammeovirga yaeyamensis]QWG00909.1 FecR domain-containing protein [Flammeovirga yaeyamensis]